MENIRIQYVLDKYNISAAELGRRLGVSRSSITNTINNGNPGIQMLLKWADAIGCSATEFIEEAQPKENVITCPNCGTKLEVKEKE
ncbi:MAG: hypothetical protein BGN96_12245 [Bacteroidales bacterium 45-6]|nr:MAG: hypothetical protein BGN96_12245 [Bacteroidales bacterium 45-6]